MTTIGDAKFLERIVFSNGQRLFASDLQALEQFNREMRWLHNQSLHQPGVGNGYAVTKAEKGAREVTIGPGYAIDDQGREIVLTQEHVEPLPPVAHDGAGNPVAYDLTVSYPDDSFLDESETRKGVCAAAGAVRLREEPVFCWVRLGGEDKQPVDPGLKYEIETARKIRLARVQILNCQLEHPASTVERRNARPSRQPFISCGSAGMAQPGLEFNLSPAGLTLFQKVDTSAARFHADPCYCAHVVGERVFHFGLATETLEFILDGTAAVSKSSAASFEFTFLIPDFFFSLSGLHPGFLSKMLVHPSELTQEELQATLHLLSIELRPGQRARLLEELHASPPLLETNRWRIDWIGSEG